MMAPAPMIKAGLIGRGIGASSSPSIHQREAAAHGVPLTYSLLDFDQLGLADDALADALARVAAEGFSGVNITHPFKQAVLPLLDEVAETALALGAVNCVELRDGRTIGSNSDWIGFTFLMEHDLPGVSLGDVTLVGAGGAGSAAGFALLKLGVRTLRIFDPDRTQAMALAERLGQLSFDGSIVIPNDAEDAITGADGIVQASPIGMAAHAGTPFDPALLSPAQWLADLIYFPRETELVLAAKQRGLRAVGGSAMVVGQAAAPFRIFTGREPNLDRMLAVFAATDTRCETQS